MIKKARVEDILAVAHMAKNFEQDSQFVIVDPEYTTERYSELINAGTGAIFVTKANGKIVGGIGGLFGPDLHSPRIIAVETFWFILPEHRGHGLKLMERFEGWAAENNCDAVAMVHMVDSHPEILEKIYKRKGYSLIEKHWLKVIK